MSTALLYVIALGMSLWDGIARCGSTWHPPAKPRVRLTHGGVIQRRPVVLPCCIVHPTGMLFGWRVRADSIEQAATTALDLWTKRQEVA